MAQIIITYYPQRGAINIKGHPLLITDKVMALGVLEYAKETIVANINEALAPRIQQATNIPLDLKLASR